MLVKIIEYPTGRIARTTKSSGSRSDKRLFTAFVNVMPRPLAACAARTMRRFVRATPQCMLLPIITFRATKGELLGMTTFFWHFLQIFERPANAKLSLLRESRQQLVLTGHIYHLYSARNKRMTKPPSHKGSKLRLLYPVS